MKRTLTQLLFVCSLSMALAFGQNSTGAPNPANRVAHRVSFLTTLLNLTTAQQQQATTILTNAATAEANVHSQMKTARLSLTTAIRNNDAATIDQVAASIGNLIAQSTATQARADAAFYLILMPDQQAKLAQFESQGNGFGRGMGPAGLHR
jgi:Spy/CpxP family protein refolding chaperone